MKLLKLSIAVVCLVAVHACAVKGTVMSGLSPEVKNAVAACSAGYEASFSLKAEAAIKENGGTINAGTEEALKGVFLNKPGLAGADALAAYKEYLKCLDDRTKAQKVAMAEADACEAKLKCDMAANAGMCICSDTTAKYAKDHSLSAAKAAELTTNTCGPAIQEISQCWDKQPANMARSACEVTVKAAGRQPPVKGPGKCGQYASYGRASILASN